MKTRQIKSSLKHVASYACPFGKVPKVFLFTFSIQIFTFPYTFWVTIFVRLPPTRLNHTPTEGDLGMRKLLYAFGLTSALVFALAAQAAAPPPNFAGTWTLDKSKSQGLSQRMQNVESASWVITQTDKEISIEEKITGGTPPQGGPGGGGPGAGGPQGGGGGRGMMGPRTFNLDGSETTGEMGRGKFARKATLSSDGKTLELMSKMTFQGPDGEIVSTTSDKLTLSADGNMLTVVRHSESPRGAQDSTLVFNK